MSPLAAQEVTPLPGAALPVEVSDTDQDGLTDAEELDEGTDVNNPDTDTLAPARPTRTQMAIYSTTQQKSAFLPTLVLLTLTVTAYPTVMR